MTDGPRTQTYAHNGLGKIRTATVNGTTTRFVYGPSGKQIAVVTPTSTTLRLDPAMEIVKGAPSIPVEVLPDFHTPKSIE